jgi:rare lipoprotein A
LTPRLRIAVASLIVVLAYGCASTSPTPTLSPDTLRGVASWYGEEFAGRTTANGEIFDPLLMTAAHRTLPFGTVVDVMNAKTRQTVRVRVNDRGPYVGKRVIDLSYAAAQQIGLIEPGIGDVEIHVVHLGKGDREPPAPLEVTVAESPKTAPQVAAGDPPPVAFPIPTATNTAKPSTKDEPAIVDRVEVVEQHSGVMTRKQVADDGKTIETVPVEGGAPVVSAPGHSSAEAVDRRAPSAAPPARRSGLFVIQVGAFSQEANAKALQQRLARIGQDAWVDAGDLWRVRIGPFPTRDLAIKTRAELEANGVSAIIVSE